jgi:hypothetical protein
VAFASELAVGEAVCEARNSHCFSLLDGGEIQWAQPRTSPGDSDTSAGRSAKSGLR